MTAAPVIRDARLPEDEPAFLRFIYALQAYEHDFEPNRRLDDRVAREHWENLRKKLAERQGRIFVADAGSGPIGWGVALIETDDLFVVESERRYGYVTELHLDEAARGQGLATALMAACEAYFRSAGVSVSAIGALAGNARALAVYQHLGYAPAAIHLRRYL